jgi:plastocyanin
VRRYRLIRRTARACVGLGLALGLVGCGAAVPPATQPTDGFSVSVETAPGAKLAFEPPVVTVDAVAPLTVTFHNRSTLPHNMVFTEGLAASTRTIVEPGTSDQLRVVPERPGTYPFVCTIHTGMAGSLIVEGAAN